MAVKRPKDPSALSRDERAFAVALMEHLVVPTFVVDPEGRVMVWNKACERLTRVSSAAVIGGREHWRAFYDEARPCLADLLVQGRLDEIAEFYGVVRPPGEDASASAAIHVENWCLMPALGEKRYLAVDAGPIFDEQGRLIAVVETLRDITSHREAQIELQRLASHDELTGVANRRVFGQTLAAEWSRACRERRPLSVVMADVDCFKLYNDALGHQMGDQCLRAVAGALEGAVRRPGDLVARYGGEEFVAILPGIPLEGALVVGENMCAAVRGLGVRHPASTVSDVVTLSAGVATVVPDADGQPDVLLGLADKALYRAKAEGRDKVLG